MGKRVFISQPMNGMTDEEISEARANAIKEIKTILDEDVYIIDSVIEERPETNNDGLWYLGKSLQMMATADNVYFADGWKNKRGCVIEHQCAQLYGLNIIKE